MSTQFDLTALKARILAAKQSAAASQTVSIESLEENPPSPKTEIAAAVSADSNLFTGQDRFGNAITYNQAQSDFIRLAASGKSCALIGAAGTGKTTTQRAAIIELLNNGMIPPIGSHSHSHLPPSNSPGIAICAFTRRATNNIRKNLTEDLQPNCLTIHKLLEYQPVDYETMDPETGKTIKTKRFEPTRHSQNPLPDTLRVIVIEEASMVSTQLYQEVIDACPHKPQLIFLGDIQQLPPVFGSAILGFALSSLPVVELTEVYRQALESPILSLAHRILSGKPILAAPTKSEPESILNWNLPAKGLVVHPWKKQISPENAVLTLAKFFITALNKGQYDPATDGILIPFNKSCGTIELNSHIANAIARNEERMTFQVLHGFQSSYYSIGDKCLYDKEDALILDIYPNPSYLGKRALDPSTSLNYWGHYVDSSEPSYMPVADDEEDVDALLAAVNAEDWSGDEEERTRAASHCITLRLLDSERAVTIRNAGELQKLDLGYAITVHKSQGSEWNKVFLCFHKSHATMLQRELLYTAVTRAKQELFVICEKDTLEKGIASQRIKGDSLNEKAEYFKGKYNDGDHPTFW